MHTSKLIEGLRGLIRESEPSIHMQTDDLMNFLSRVKARDKEAVEMYLKQIEKLAGWVADGVCKECGDHDIEELIQAGLSIALDIVDTYDPNKGAKFSTWSVLRLKNHFINEILKMRRAERKPEPKRDDIESPEKEALRQELRELVKKHLSSLEPTDREIVSLYYGFKGDELSFSAIAQKLGISKQAVQQRLKRLMDRLKVAPELKAVAVPLENKEVDTIGALIKRLKSLCS